MVKQDRTINDTDYAGIRHVVKNEDFQKFEAILAYNMMFKFNCENNKGGLEEIDQELCDKLKLYEDVDELVDNAFSCISAACNTVFMLTRGAKHILKKNTVPWWTEELMVLRKRTYALRRRYQRTTNNENLRQERKTKYFEGR
jgi:hypothetical protein